MSSAQELLERVRSDGLVASGRPVVVLLSGGQDSTCLLDVAARVAGPGAVRALHVNYGLREEATAEERHCVQLCERIGVDIELRRPEHPPRGNVQAWAREERYRLAASLARARDADVAAGHTATDQLETILYRLASSPSRRALLGMGSREPLPGAPSVSLVRPLLRFWREQTAAYCSERNLGWREDPSNRTPAYARNRIRSVLMPALLEVHPAAPENVLALAETLREEAAVLDAVIDQVLGGSQEISLAGLRELSPALRRLVVQRLADQAIGGPAAGVARRADEVAGLADRGRAALDLPHGVRAIAEDGTVRFERTPPLGDRNMRARSARK